MTPPKVLILMGSDSDWEVMSEARKALDELGIASRGARVLGAPDPGADRAARARGGRAGHPGHRVRRGRRGPPRGRLRRGDRAAGARRAARVVRPARASTRSSRPRRCPAACRSARSPSARPGARNAGLLAARIVARSDAAGRRARPRAAQEDGGGGRGEGRRAAGEARRKGSSRRGARADLRPVPREGDPPPVPRGAPLPHPAPARDPDPRPGRRALRLGRVARSTSPSIVVALVPNVLGYVLPIAFLLGAVIGVGRLSEDREVIALGAAGISPGAPRARPARARRRRGRGRGLWLSTTLEPAGLAAARVRLNEVVKRNVTNDVRAGTFYDQIPGYTLYAERVRSGGWENVLISDRSNPAAPVLALARPGPARAGRRRAGDAARARRRRGPPRAGRVGRVRGGRLPSRGGRHRPRHRAHRPQHLLAARRGR